MRSIYLLSVAFSFFCAGSALGAPPCSLLTKDQVSAVLGTDVGPGEPIGNRTCSWAASGRAEGTNTKTVNVTLLSDQEHAANKLPLGKNIVKEHVAGLADDAVSTKIAKAATLAVKKGNSALLVRMYGVPSEQVEDKEKAIAQAVLGKL